jgi:hypothetical protein
MYRERALRLFRWQGDHRKVDDVFGWVIHIHVQGMEGHYQNYESPVASSNPTTRMAPPKDERSDAHD